MKPKIISLLIATLLLVGATAGAAAANTSPAFRAKTSASNSATSLAVPAPAGVVSGDCQVAVALLSTTSETFGATPSGWTRVQLASTSGDSFAVAVYTSTTATAAATFTKSGSRAWQIARTAHSSCSGFGPSAIVVRAAGTSHATPSVTTVTDADAVVGAVATEGSASPAQSFTPPAGWTERHDAVVTTENEALGIADKTVTTGGTATTGTFTSSKSDVSITAAVVLKSVAAAPAQCADGIDNDADTLTDYPADPGCSSSTDNDETNAASRFTLIYSDDFNGTTLNPVWEKYGATEDWPGHGGNGLRVGRAVSVHDGIADITAQEVNNVIESGAFTMKDPAYRIAYGRYETRVRVDNDPSLTMSALALLWNVDETAHPWCQGESDFYETGTTHADWSTFLHWEPVSNVNCSDATTQDSCSYPDDATVWHDIALEWEPSRYAVFIDGTLRCTITDPDHIPDWAQRLTFQLDAMDPDMGSTVVHMNIDYARIYARNATP